MIFQTFGICKSLPDTCHNQNIRIVHDCPFGDLNTAVFFTVKLGESFRFVALFPNLKKGLNFLHGDLGSLDSTQIAE